MHKLYKSAILVFVAISGAGAARCETYTMETYYPSPAGVYNNLTVTSTTVLARDGGGVSVGTLARPSDLKVTGVVDAGAVVIPGRLPSDPTLPAYKIEGAIYFNTTTKSHKVYKNSQWMTIGGGTEIMGAEDGYTGYTGNQACQARGFRCIKVVSYNYILQDAGCPSATHCLHICATYYNQGLPGVQNGGDHDNIHSCDAQLGNYTTYLHAGVVRCNAFFSAVCAN